MRTVFTPPCAFEFGRIVRNTRMDLDAKLWALTGFTQDDIKKLAVQGVPDAPIAKITETGTYDRFELTIGYEGVDFEHSYVLNFADRAVQDGRMLSMRQDGTGRIMAANAMIVGMITGMTEEHFAMAELMGALVWPRTGAQIHPGSTETHAKNLQIRAQMLDRFLPAKQVKRIKALCSLESDDALFKISTKLTQAIPFLPHYFNKAQKDTGRGWTHENYTAKGFFRNPDEGITVAEFLLCGLHCGGFRVYDCRTSMRRFEYKTRIPVRQRVSDILASRNIIQPTQSAAHSSTQVFQTAHPQ